MVFFKHFRQNKKQLKPLKNAHLSRFQAVFNLQAGLYTIYLRITDIISEIVEKYPFLKDFGGKFVTYALLTTKNERYLLRLSFPFYV